MVNFNSLSEGEKLAFSKDFLIRYKVVKKLKPNIASEKDILTLVSHKFYDDNLSLVHDCIKFMGSKSKFNSLEEVNLDSYAQEYKESLDAQINSVQDEFKKKKAEEDLKEKEYKKFIDSRNSSDKEYNDAVKKRKRNDVLKFALVCLALVAGVAVIASLGGIIATINALTGLLMELSFMQQLTLFLVAWAGYKGYFKSIGEKVKKSRDGRREKKEKKFNDINEKHDKCAKDVKEKESEYAKAKMETENTKAEIEKRTANLSKEKAFLQSYEKMCNFENRLQLSEVLINEKFNNVVSTVADDDDKSDLESWRNHYIGSLYANAYRGTLRSKEDIDAIVQEARSKFDEISSPLNMTTFSDKNIKTNKNEALNTPLEEIYESI